MKFYRWDYCDISLIYVKQLDTTNNYKFINLQLLVTDAIYHCILYILYFSAIT